jgi:hypothetical protein
MQRAAPVWLFCLLGCSGQQAIAPGDDAAADVASDASAGDDAGDAADATDGASSYANPSMWLCGAGTPHDYCLDPETATAIQPDLSQTPVPITPASNPPVDCFYIYPTVDISDPAGNVKDFSNLPDILDPVLSQAAPFSEVCSVYAPLYHQATFNAYTSPDADQYLEAAYVDVAAAFHEYMTAFNKGRDFVLLGHSQGSHMLRRLVQREVESSPDVQKHLVVAILLGALGDITVPKGQLVGSSFKSTPLCTQDTERDCVITVNTFAKGYEPTSTYGMSFGVGPGQDIGCTNPAALGGGKAMLGGAYFYDKYHAALAPPVTTGVSTTFGVFGDYFTGQCVPNANGYSFFEVDAEPNAGDKRTNPVPFGNLLYTPAILGLHLLDYSFPMQELLDAVRKRTGTYDGGSPDAGDAGAAGDASDAGDAAAD